MSAADSPAAPLSPEPPAGGSPGVEIVTPSAVPPVFARQPIPMRIIPPSLWDRVETMLERVGEYINPILVKEARQALKSKQFVITFTLVLICGWGWSLLGVAFMGEDAMYSPGGPYMLTGYHWVLAFPLILIVPFAAFRSLAGEREDGTYELLSITTLWPRQIIGGKLGSAVLQMIVYLSALAPCIAFTYLLRGIDIISILLFVAYTVVTSLLLSLAGLLLGTVSKAKHWQIVLSVLMILALAAVYIFGSWIVSAALMFGESLYIDQPEFWIGHLCGLSVLVSFYVLLYMAAAARISFASDNRSTKLRYVMLAQQLLITGWCMYYALAYKEEGDAPEAMLVLLFTLSAAYWLITGTLMCGESPQLSQRVKRSLPQSLLGRTLLTWLNPGPGTGFMFAICNLLSVTLLGLLTGLIIKSDVNPTPYDPLQKGVWGFVLRSFHSLDPEEVGFAGRVRQFLAAFDWSEEWLMFGLLAFCYVVCYLGLGRLVLLVARTRARVGLFVSLLLQVVLQLLGSFAPWIVQVTILRESSFTVLLTTSPYLTLFETLDGDILSHDAKFLFWTFPIVPVAVVSTAFLMLLVNLIASARDAIHERQAAPQRVVEDELALHPERTERPARLSPWDEEPDPSPFAKP